MLFSSHVILPNFLQLESYMIVHYPSPVINIHALMYHVSTSLSTQLANVLAAAFVLLVHLLTKPFRKDHNNIIETVILLNLVIVTVSYLEPPAGEFHKVLVVAVTILPYLFALGFLVMKAGKKM